MELDEITLFFIKVFNYKRRGIEITEEVVDMLLKEAIEETKMHKYTTVRG